MKDFSNINTYLMQAKQELSVGNYNEVDALIFAQLSYYPFENIYKGNESVWLPELAEKIMKQPDFATVYPDEKKTFIVRLSQSKRYLRCLIHHMQATNTVDTQWAAFTVDIGKTGVSVIAMRGTDGTEAGWTENFRLAYNIVGTGAQLESYRYLKQTAAKKVYLTGHSKGGNNIASAYVMSNSYIRDKVIRIDNFDGPGVNPEFADNYMDGYWELHKKQFNFYPSDSVIGLLLKDNPGKTFYVKTLADDRHSIVSLLSSHIPFTFLVEGNIFLKTSQSELSEQLNKKLDNIMKKTSNTQRYRLVQMIEHIGVPDLISNISEGNVKKKIRGIYELINMPREFREIIFYLMRFYSAK